MFYKYVLIREFWLILAIIMFPHLAKFLQSFKFKLFHCLQKQAAFLVLSIKRISYKLALRWSASSLYTVLWCGLWSKGIYKSQYLKSFQFKIKIFAFWQTIVFIRERSSFSFLYRAQNLPSLIFLNLQTLRRRHCWYSAVCRTRIIWT